MTSTAVVTEDATTIVADDGSRFNWGIALVGAIGATATMVFLVALGVGVGLSFLSVPPTARSATVFLSLGAIYFFAAQAFGFAVGGYLAGRLIGPAAENTKEEEFRAAAHGFAVWALAVVASVLIAGASSSLTAAGLAASSPVSAEDPGYFVDLLFRPASATPQVLADKAEAGRILAIGASSGGIPAAWRNWWPETQACLPRRLSTGFIPSRRGSARWRTRRIAPAGDRIAAIQPKHSRQNLRDNQMLAADFHTARTT
jgi:hypothetical protein